MVSIALLIEVMLQNLVLFLFLSISQLNCGLIMPSISLVKGLHTSLKPEKALIYLYDSRMVGMSELGSVQAMVSLCASYRASNCYLCIRYC